MPTWQAPLQEEAKDSLTEAWSLLNEQVQDGPAYEEVTGIPLAVLAAHAVEALSSTGSIDTAELSGELADMPRLVQIYVLGFTVGSKHGELRARRE